MNIPAELQSAMNNPLVKAAWISDFPSAPLKCQNCGGNGVIAIFIATEGPYDQPGHPYLVKEGVHLTSKSDIINGQVKYWVGQTISAPCPDCQNTIAPKAVTPEHIYHSKAAAKQLAAQFDVRDRKDIDE